MFGQDDPVPPPPFFSSDFGDSHDLAGLEVGGGARAPPVDTLLYITHTHVHTRLTALLPGLPG